MLKRGIIILALVATVVLPFMLRPKQPSPEQADDTLVIITPHNAAIREEFALGFRDWYKARTGRTVFVDWRLIGGTSEIARYLEGEYVASFRNLWTAKPGRAWSNEVQSGFQNARLAPDAPAIARNAREVFLGSEAGCGIDLFFGGGAYDFDMHAQAGRLVDSGLRERHADWFTDDAFPLTFGGEEIRDGANLWFGTVLSSYGILFNRDSLKRLGFDREPEQWADLADPRFLGEIGLCDPTKSGSIAVAFENVIQQQIHRRLGALAAAGKPGDPKAEAGAVRQGWVDGLRLLQLVGANARYFTDTSQKPPIDVATGDCAAGMCIDFYGREQQEAVRRRGGSDRIGYISPEGGSAYSVDPIALLRGAPHRSVAVAFIEYVLSLEGQKLWNFRTAAPGGPRHFALRRLPVRRDFYGHGEWTQYRSDPDVDPFSQKQVLVYHPEWTSPLFRELAYVIRLMTEDTHQELAGAWRAIIAAPEPSRSRALAVLQDVSFVDYDQARGSITRALVSKNQVDEVSFARDLGDRFRRNYERAERIARGGK
jgi:iron(III) transport system substrate-binding protein